MLHTFTYHNEYVITLEYHLIMFILYELLLSFSSDYPTWLRFWVTCWVTMISLCHSWGCQPPQTASQIHIRHTSVCAHWYAFHGHTVSSLHSYTHPTWLRFWGSGSLMESKLCHYVIVEADSHLKLLPTSILNIYKVFEHIDMLSIDIQ